MSIEQLLSLADQVFVNFNEFRNKLYPDEYTKRIMAYTLLRTCPQPPEWIRTGKSELNGSEYQYNDIELLEGILDRLFPEWGYDFLFPPIFITDKNGIAVTQTVRLNTFYTDTQINYADGTATEYCNSLQMLTLATPKAASMAFKNACKKFGKFLGGDLNRSFENENLPIISPENSKFEIEIDDEFKATKEKIISANNKTDALNILNESTFKFNSELKNIIKEKQ